ncbi:MAG: uracil-DNA glycosylase [Clostridia bacterium]|jgi:DNA polymerase|nr:Uracil glycosylase superfamily protein [Clostridiales bacterium]MDK2984404.1 uracil-DNA glycosylase [Clostridia bacterium]
MNFETLRKSVAECRMCELYKTRNALVLDDCDEKVDIFLMGEAPGGHEDTVSGKPFTGDAGKNLRDFLRSIGLSRNKLYIGNTVKCRPVKPSPRGRYKQYTNRRPTRQEIKLCSKWLFKELEIIGPKVAVALGGVPLSIVTGKNTPLKDFHGKEIFWQEKKLPVFVLYHPAAVTYNPRLKETYHRDLEKLKEFLTKHDIGNI